MKFSTLLLKIQVFYVFDFISTYNQMAIIVIMILQTHCLIKTKTHCCIWASVST